MQAVLGYCQKVYSLRFEDRPSAPICRLVACVATAKSPYDSCGRALFALAGAVSKVLDGLFHTQRYIGELIEVFGQVAGKALLLRAAAASCSSLGCAPGVAQMP